MKLTLILRRNRFFRKVTDLPRATLRTGARVRSIVNRNDLVREVAYVNGVKTGHTLGAGYVLVGSATRRGVTVVAAVLGDPSDRRARRRRARAPALRPRALPPRRRGAPRPHVRHGGPRAPRRRRRPRRGADRPAHRPPRRAPAPARRRGARAGRRTASSADAAGHARGAQPAAGGRARAARHADRGGARDARRPRGRHLGPHAPRPRRRRRPGPYPSVPVPAAPRSATPAGRPLAECA